MESFRKTFREIGSQAKKMVEDGADILLLRYSFGNRVSSAAANREEAEATRRLKLFQYHLVHDMNAA